MSRVSLLSIFQLIIKIKAKQKEKNTIKAFEFISGDDYWIENTSYKRFERPYSSKQNELYERMKNTRNYRLQSGKMTSKAKNNNNNGNIQKPQSAKPQGQLTLINNFDTPICSNDTSQIADIKRFTKSEFFVNHKDKICGVTGQLEKILIENPSLNKRQTIQDKFSVTKCKPKPIIINETKELNQLNVPKVNNLFHKVNRMGPYYSHCLSCAKKNSEFYNIMNPESAVKILSLIKDEKKKTNNLMY